MTTPSTPTDPVSYDNLDDVLDPVPPPSINALIETYGNAMTTLARARYDAALHEIARAEWVNARIAALVADGSSATAADKAAHADPEHRAFQRAAAELTMRVDMADRAVRVLAYRIRLAFADRESAAVAQRLRAAIATVFPEVTA